MEPGLIKAVSYKAFLYLAIYEFLGTFIALVGVNCAFNDPVVVGVAIFIAATLTGKVSGGHFNAAVTIAVYICEGKWLANFKVALMYIIVDQLGAFLAMGVVIMMLGTDGIFSLMPPKSKKDDSYPSVLSVLFAEMLFTFVLISAVLFIKYRKVAATSDGMLSNLTVGLAVYVSASMSGPISGGGLNPTFAFALITTQSILTSLNE